MTEIRELPMSTVAALAEDLAELQDVMFAIEATRGKDVGPVSEAAPALSIEQRTHLRADSRARAWIPSHLVDSLR